VEYYSYLVQNEFQEELQELDFPSHHISMPSFPDIFIRITRGVRKKRDLFCLLLVPVKLHFVRHMKVFMFLSSFSLFRRITNLNISQQQDGKCRFINLPLSLEKLQQSSSQTVLHFTVLSPSLLLCILRTKRVYVAESPISL